MIFEIRFLDKDYRRRFVALVADLVEADRQSIITRLAEASREFPAAQQMPLVDTRGKSTLAGIMNIVSGDAATIRVDSPRFEMRAFADIIFGSSNAELQATQSALRHWYIEIIPDLNEPGAHP